MSFNLILDATASDKPKIENRPVSPTLVLGLGGTGKDVLFRLRRLIVERYGSLQYMPFVQFLHLDTDQTSAAQEQYDVKADDDPLYDEVRFRPAEKINLTIEGGTARYVENINSFPHIKRWFLTDGKIAQLGDLGKGAGQVRMASRLGLYDSTNFNSLTHHLERTRRVLKDAANQAKAADLDFQLDASKIHVFVVGSLAGGTGGGVFLDMGYLLRQHFSEAERTGIFLLPGFFAGYSGAARMKANGYASLMELNHYSFGNHFHADWDGTGSAQMPPPPYGITYLIDSENAAGLQIGSSGKELDCYQMVAEYLFQDFNLSSFAGRKRAVRVNLENFSLGVYSHNYLNEALNAGKEGQNIVGDTYPTRFSSFGLSSILFPTDRVHRACGARLARAVLDLWEQELLSDPQEALFQKILNDSEIRFVQGRYERTDGAGVIEGMQLEETLLRYDENSGRTFPQLIWERARNIRTDIESAPNGEKAPVLRQHREEVEKLVAREDSIDRDEWGQWVRTLDTNARACLERLKHKIRERASEIADDDRYGVAYILSMLQELKALLHNDNFYYLRYFKEQVDVWRDYTEDYQNRLDQLQLDVERHERQLLFRAADLQRDMSLLVADDSEAEELGDLYNYLYARIMRQVSRRGRWICEEIDDFLGKDDPTGEGLIGDYFRLLAGFRTLRQRLERKEDYFSRPVRSELTIRLYHEGDVEEWYGRWVGEGPEAKDRLRVIGNRLLSEVFHVDSVSRALQKIRTTAPEEIEEGMLDQCTSFFTGQQEQPSALEILFRGGLFSEAERAEKVRLAYQLGKVWLAKSQAGLAHVNVGEIVQDQRPMLIGLDTSNEVLKREFVQLIDNIRSPEDSEPSYLSIGERNRGTIVFFNEVAGIPAFYARTIHQPGGLRSSYRKFADKDELHIHKNRFQFGDLVPKTNEEGKRLADALRAFLLARVLGILRVKEIWERNAEHPVFLYSYKRRENFTVEEIPLGTEPQAIEKLYDEEGEEHLTHRYKLLREIEKMIDELRDNRLLSVYAILIEFYLHYIYPKRQETVGGERQVDRYSPEYAVLSRARQAISDLLGRDEEMEQLEVAVTKLRIEAGGKEDDEKLEYEQYMQVLKRYSKPAGKFPQTISRTTGAQRVEWLEALALDRERVLGAKPTVNLSRTPARKEEGRRSRPCPSCGEPIDVRAVYCRHCSKTIASHVTCLHCGEDKVPDDLADCWNCGRRLPEQAEQIECARCFSFTGYPEDFPCPECGYDPGQETREPQTMVLRAAAGGDSMGTSFGLGGESPEPAADGSPGAALGKVQCPTCFEEVAVAPECGLCGGPLQA